MKVDKRYDMTNYQSTDWGEGVSKIRQVIISQIAVSIRTYLETLFFWYSCVANVVFFTFASDEQVAAVMGTYGGSSQGVTFIITMVS